MLGRTFVVILCMGLMAACNSTTTSSKSPPHSVVSIGSASGPTTDGSSTNKLKTPPAKETAAGNPATAAAQKRIEPWILAIQNSSSARKQNILGAFSSDLEDLGTEELITTLRYNDSIIKTLGKKATKTPNEQQRSSAAADLESVLFYLLKERGIDPVETLFKER